MDEDKEQLDKKRKGREILDLTVGEVSPVDRPAVLEDWVVVKRLEKQEDNMGAFDSDQDGTGAVDVGYQWIEVDLEKSLEADLISATKPATEFLEAVEKGEDKHLKEEVLKALPADLKAAITRTLAFLGKVAGGKYPYPKPAGKADDNEKATLKSITDVADWAEKEEITKELPADLKTALTRVMAFLRKVAAGGYPMPTAKAEGGDGKGTPTTTTPTTKQDATTDDQPSVEQQVQTVLEDIFKGKRFTDARKEGIATMAKQALALLSEVDAEAVKKIITEKVQALKGEIKWAATPPPASSGTDVKKDVEEAVSKAMEDVSKKLDDVSSRVEGIEKTRQAPQSGDPDATDKTVTKSESKWKGLPLPQ